MKRENAIVGACALGVILAILYFVNEDRLIQKRHSERTRNAVNGWESENARIESKVEAYIIRMIDRVNKENSPEYSYSNSPDSVKAWFYNFSDQKLLSRKSSVIFISKGWRPPQEMRNFTVKFVDGSRVLTEADKLNGRSGLYYLIMRGAPCRSKSIGDMDAPNDYRNVNWMPWENREHIVAIRLEETDGIISHEYIYGPDFRSVENLLIEDNLQE